MTIVRRLMVSIAVAACVLASSLARAAVAPAARVVGELELCGGPAPGKCITGAYTSCTGDRCVVADRVAIVDRLGRVVASRRLRHGRFTLTLRSGTYVAELLGDGNNGRPVRGRIMERRSIRVRGGQTVHVRFVIPIR